MHQNFWWCTAPPPNNNWNYWWCIAPCAPPDNYRPERIHKAKIPLKILKRAFNSILINTIHTSQLLKCGEHLLALKRDILHQIYMHLLVFVYSYFKWFCLIMPKVTLYHILACQDYYNISFRKNFSKTGQNLKKESVEFCERGHCPIGLFCLIHSIFRHISVKTIKAKIWS